MYIPPLSVLEHGVHEFGKKHASSGDWSSLIGVITAICGNILISFALNTQRYAHIRLGRDRESRQKAAKRKAKSGQSSTSYGTNGATGDEEDGKRLAQNGSDGDLPTDETQPLIRRATSRKVSTSSEETIRDDQQDDAEDKEKSYLKSPIWWLGISMMVVGEAGNFLAYGFAPASIVSPLGVVALVSNCLIAPLLLGEKFRWRDAIGVLIAIGGCVVVVLSASESNPKLTPDAIWYLVSRWEFETYLGITLFLIIALAVGSNKFGERTILIDLGLVALFGAYTALSTKGIASLLALNIWRVVTFPITYLLLAVLVFTAVMQIKYVNRALQRFNATMVIPTQFVLFTISVIVGSAVLYRDFEREKTDDAIKFVAGCALTFFGVWCITSGRNDDTDAEDEMDEEESEIDVADEEMNLTKADEQSNIDHSIPVRSIRRAHTSGEMPANSLSKSGPSLRSVPSVEISGPEATLPVLKSPFGDILPANSTAAHMENGGRLATPGGDPQKPPFHATTSAPVVPTTPVASSSATFARTPLVRTPSTPNRTSPTHQQSLRTPSNQTLLDPNTSPNRLLNRNSVAGLLPGPLTSPLSGSLAAIVADELRRSTGNTIRRKKAVPLTTGPAITGTRPKRHSIASGTEADFDNEVVIGDPSSESLPTRAGGGGRIRSLSATLGDIFGSVGRRVGGARAPQDSLQPDP